MFGVVCVYALTCACGGVYMCILACVYMYEFMYVHICMCLVILVHLCTHSWTYVLSPMLTQAKLDSLLPRESISKVPLHAQHVSTYMCTQYQVIP